MDINEFENIRHELIEEANTSPNMLTDIAGLESYISESYNNRSFIELLQNADDAKSSKFLIVRVGDYLVIANDGREFSNQDLMTLCRSASSNKERGSSIGYRGIGFKSVVNIAKEIHIVSGDLKISFSREQTKNVVPMAKKVPLVRIPHTISTKVYTDIQNSIDQYKSQGYITFFVFSDVAMAQIEEEYKMINNSSLLFLRNITLIDNRLLNSSINISKEAIPDLGQRIKLSNYGDLLSEWIVYSQNQVNIAFQVESDGVKRLERNNGTIYAFLPTEDTSGLGVIINADFSTDPSRRHLLNDETTRSNIGKICKAYGDIFKQYISDETQHAKNIIKALTPYTEPSLVQFSGNLFEKIFYTEIKKNIDFKRLVFKPNWLNEQDFLGITKGIQVRAVANSDVYSTLPVFLKYLGARELQLNEICNSEILTNIELSLSGSTQIASRIIKAQSVSNTKLKLDELPLFFCENERISLKKINSQSKGIDESYLNTLFEYGVTRDEFKKALKRYELSNILSQFESEDTRSDKKNENGEELSALVNKEDSECKSNSIIQDWYKNTFKICDSNNKELISTKTWRNAEQQVLHVLNQNGFNLEDVSKQNLGYDLQGIDPNGDYIYLEVKSISSLGQNFRMTNNEYAVAQVKGDKYLIAVTYVNNNELKLALYSNPIKSLRLNRSCVQWIWECNEYNFNPQIFKL